MSQFLELVILSFKTRKKTKPYSTVVQFLPRMCDQSCRVMATKLGGIFSVEREKRVRLFFKPVRRPLGKLML